MAEEALPTPPASPMQVMIDNFNRLSPRQKMAGAAALALAIALLVGVWLWSQQPQYSVLFSNVEEKDGGAIVTALQQQNVPYQIENGGATIMVPSTRANELRLTLAAQGLPRGGSVGFELLENQKLGLSQFHEQVNYQRALEGELARTIQSIAAVAGARVHLAIPKQSAFLRNEQKPTASIVVSLRAGRTLDAAQIAGIVHLVSSSVPELAANQVSVIDQNGNLLARQRKQGGPALDDTQLEYVRNVEESYITRIQKILDPMLGSTNFRAQVMADVDFDDAEQTSETYKPNPPPNTSIRSLQTSENIANNPGPLGVPGALSNQPPVPATAPITSPVVPGTVAQSGPVPIPLNSSKTATTNFEVDKTVQHVKRALGQVKRLSVALLVNHKSEKDAKGNFKTVPLTEAEVKKINDLVREAVGYSEKRGDTINVTNTAFTDPAKEDVVALPMYKDPEVIALLKELARWLVLALVILFVIKKVIQPLMRSVAPPKPEEEEEEIEAPLSAENLEERAQMVDSDIPPEVLELELAKMSFEKKLARAREVAKKDPKMVAQLIKEWMGGGASGEGR
ncbi:flagellar basal-body MS-ring/collar protein FliF [Uliginosibacterium sp. 31-16]|uniref:flagellar basal-body MS-ring/collar protein FliF n=1 Tax=Uliginosibacterium sp. 31-16 TaxID=3068315 RepID=UPI00273FB218|nr:flagellar basal-body MS-ring/collar protein FliF [Uliginosibacterium sp. 31-16]MDP5240787.1 flagellar basal-body MS-ring/collar protein FliF [Uliginosibacterium sp. 31-16]